MVYGLHGAVGEAGDLRALSRAILSNSPSGAQGMMSRVDLWRYLQCCPMSLTEFAAAFNREVKAQAKHTAPDILGYSMGGRLALHALLADPSLWRSAVIVSAHTGLGEEQRGARLAHDASWAAKALKGEWQQFLDEWNAQGVLGNEVMPNRNKLATRREAVARSFMDWSLGTQLNLLDELPRITCPVLWVVGERDEKFKAIAELAVQALPNARLEVVKNAGHRVPWEAPAAFHSLVREWIAERVSAG